MFYRLRRIVPAMRFDRRVHPILETAPLRLRKRGVAVLSMVRTVDLASYLLALKSFSAAIPVGKVTAVIDRAAPRPFRRTLEAHIPGVELVELESIGAGPCQHGGTWERILFILDRSQREYVVQLDADTLTLGSGLDEVAACIGENRAFTLGGGPAGSGQKIVTMTEAAASLDFESDYIGIVAQRRFRDYPNAEHVLYVRGSSGFAGFVPGGITREAVEEFHTQMAPLLGERWREWGTEQCASNFAIANTPGARVLPWPAYANFRRDRPPTEATRFLHFIGKVRYDGGVYARLASGVIRELPTREPPRAQPEAAAISALGYPGN